MRWGLLHWLLMGNLSLKGQWLNGHLVQRVGILFTRGHLILCWGVGDEGEGAVLGLGLPRAVCI